VILLILGERDAAEARARELEKTLKKAEAGARKATLQAERAAKTHEANIERTERSAAQQLAASGRAHEKQQERVYATVVKELGPRAASFDLLFCNDYPTNRRPVRIA
jgi:hypothetical protein